MQSAVLSSQCSPLPLLSASSSKSLLPSLSHTEDHCHSNCRHKILPRSSHHRYHQNHLLRSTSSEKNRRHRASHTLPKVIYIDDTCSTRHQTILLTLHAPMHLWKPTDVILLTSVTTSALAYISCHIINSLHLRHHPCHRSAS